MPTLLEVNKIVLQPWHSPLEKKQIQEEKSIDFIMNWIADRMWENKDTPPKVKPKGIGSKVLVLRSGTGSGKSTLLPPFLYNMFYEKTHGNIIITQPTRATATDIPFQIVQYNKNLKLGLNIGFQTGTIARKPMNGILFSTTGILLQFLKTIEDDQFMKKYKFVIIDEVHNRSMDVDLTLFYIKQLLKRNWDKPECPILILTSGTFEPAIFMEYFECPKEHFIDVLGLSFPIQDNFTSFNLSNYIDYVVDLTEKIHIDKISDVLSNELFRDILIFVQGSAQIKKITDKIHYLNTKIFSKGLEEAKKHSAEQQKKYKGGKEKPKAIDIYYLAPIALMSENISKGSKEYMDLYSPIETITVNIYEFDENGERLDDKILDTVSVSRRVMIGTNAIETGLTIDTLGYCIDLGFVKEAHFNPNFGCNVLVDKNVTQASSRQRRGRVGRKAPGTFYACYTKEVYDMLPKLPFPDIVKENISQFLLSTIIQETKAEIVSIDADKKDDTCFQMNQFDQQWYKIKYDGVFNASSLDFIQYPSADSIGYGVEVLHGLGFIDHEYKPTLFGMYCPKFRKLKLESIRMILAGYQYGANILDLITISCCVQIGFEIGIKKNKYKPRNPLELNETEAFYYYKLVFCDEFIEYLFIWNDFMNIIGNVGNVLEKSSKLDRLTSIPMNYIYKWCKDNSFKYDGLLKVIELRDEVIGDMLTMGLNPYYNGLLLPKGTYNLANILKRNISEGLDEIKKIKHCIYEGYRFNLCVWSPVSKKYVNQYSHNNISLDSKLIKPFTGVISNISNIGMNNSSNGNTTDNKDKEIDADIKQSVPQKIIVSAITLQESFFSKGMYEFSGGDISVMDGFVDVDVNFLQY